MRVTLSLSLSPRRAFGADSAHLGVEILRNLSKIGPNSVRTRSVASEGVLAPLAVWTEKSKKSLSNPGFYRVYGK